MKQPPTFCSHSPTKRLRNLFWTVASALGLTLISACVAPAAPPQTSMRVLIEFRVPVDGAGPALLARLASQSGTSIRHVSSVSNHLHAYELICTAGDPNCAQAMKSLQSATDIASVAPDSLRRHHTSPQP